MMIFSDYVGLPWALKGRDRAGLDCWGLVRLVYAEMRGIDLPAMVDGYETLADKAQIATLIDGQRGNWVEVGREEARSFDVALFREGAADRHVGLVVRRGVMLHIAANCTSTIEPYSTARHGARLQGIYRYGAAA